MDDQITFTIREEHVRLLRAAWIGWEDCEYGAPTIDCERVVPGDIREELGAPALSDEECRSLHEGTQTALQVILRTGSFEPGEYVADRYKRDWVKAGV